MPASDPSSRFDCRTLLAVLATLTIFTSSLEAASLHDTIRDVQRKVVKVYGAGGLRGLEAYQTGILISPEGHVLTVQSYVLDTDDLVVVLDDGRKFAAEVLGVDPIRELAVLKLPVEGSSLPCFDLAAPALAEPGERVLAVSNLFGIAAGDEPVSVLQGVVSAIAPLDARRGSSEAAFRGSVYIVDAAANNPGAAGGALVNWRGELLGLLGKELRSRTTGAWLHYAVPVDQFIGSVESIRSDGAVAEEGTDNASPTEPLTLAALGIVLVPDLLPRTPPYIDSVLPESSALRAGLKRDDLIVFVDGEPTASCSQALKLVSAREEFDAIRISVLRGGELIERTLEAGDADAVESADDDGADAESEAQEGAESTEVETDQGEVSD